MDPKSWRLYAIPWSVCSVVLDFPPLLLACATIARILKRLWRSCLSLSLRTHKPYPKWGECLTDLELLDIIHRALSQMKRADKLICMHGVDEHKACHLLWVGIGVELHDQPPIGVPHQDIGTRDASPGQERVQFGDHAPSRARQGTRVAPAIACA